MITPEFINEQCAALDARIEAAKQELLRFEGERRQLQSMVAEIMRQEQEAKDRIRMGVDGGPLQHNRLPVNESVMSGLNGEAMNEQTSDLFDKG